MIKWLYENATVWLNIWHDVRLGQFHHLINDAPLIISEMWKSYIISVSSMVDVILGITPTTLTLNTFKVPFNGAFDVSLRYVLVMINYIKTLEEP